MVTLSTHLHIYTLSCIFTEILLGGTYQLLDREIEVKKSVAERTVLARLNRKLAKDNQQMFRARETDQSFNDTGRFYVVSMDTNAITATHCDMEGWAREESALKDWEQIA